MLEKQGAKFPERDRHRDRRCIWSIPISLKGASPQEAVKASLPQLRGAFALAFVFKGHDDLMIGARKGSPLAIGYGDGEMYLGSDAIALAPFTDTISYLEDGDWVVLTREVGVIYDEHGAVVQSRGAEIRRRRRSWSTRRIIATSWPRKSTSSPKWSATRWRATSTWRPSAWRCRQSCRSTSRTSSASRSSPAAPRAMPATSPNTGSSGWRACRSKLDVASEFRYREAPLRKGDLAIFISQSGETADTLAALRYAKAQGVHTLSVVNVPTSTIARESETVLPTLAGSGNRRRLDQGLHLPADGAGRARGRRRQGARRIVRRRRGQAGAWPRRNSAPDGGGARDRAADRKAGARDRQVARTCSISAAAPAIRWRWKAR